MSLGIRRHSCVRDSSPDPAISLARSPMDDVGDGSILLHVNIESLGDKVFGHHHAGLYDARWLGQICLAKGLKSTNVSQQ